MYLCILLIASMQVLFSQTKLQPDVNGKQNRSRKWERAENLLFDVTSQTDLDRIHAGVFRDC